MKAKLHLSIIMGLIGFLSWAQIPFEENVGIANNHYHDLNIEPLDNGTGDFIVAGNLLDATLQNLQFTVKRVDVNGNIVWINTYDPAPGSAVQQIRGFDITIQGNSIFATGSVDVLNSGGMLEKKVFIMEIDANVGATAGTTQWYEIVSANFNSRGVHIKPTSSDADGDGAPDPGFVVAGFFSDCFNVNTQCQNNISFLLRTDASLNVIWLIEIDTLVSNNTFDYDFANDVTETPLGFFVTGSSTAQIGANEQQGVLAHKVDFQGNILWDNSYYFGNSNDVSVDAYYDAATSSVYMLTNYSVTHYFGVTCFAASTGTINPAASWYTTGNDLDRYGFTIMESVNNPPNLVITGYDRDENWIDGNNNPQFGQSNLFVYEFDKASGNPFGATLQYLVPHMEPVGDEFNFWNAQMPLLYYPDISFPEQREDASVAEYYHVGYRTEPPATFTEAELFATTQNKRNECDNIDFVLTRNALSVQGVTVSSGFVPSNQAPFVETVNPLNYNLDMCNPTLSINDIPVEEVRLYPNPAKTEFYITSSEAKAYIITDALGRDVARGSFQSGVPINVATLGSGLYFVTLVADNQKLGTFKLLKD